MVRYRKLVKVIFLVSAWFLLIPFAPDSTAQQSPTSPPDLPLPGDVVDEDQPDTDRSEPGESGDDKANGRTRSGGVGPDNSGIANQNQSHREDAAILAAELGISPAAARRIMDFQRDFTEQVESRLLPLGTVAWYEVEPAPAVGGRVVFVGEVPAIAQATVGRLGGVSMVGGARFTLAERTVRAQAVAEALDAAEVGDYAVFPTESGVEVEVPDDLDSRHIAEIVATLPGNATRQVPEVLNRSFGRGGAARAGSSVDVGELAAFDPADITITPTDRAALAVRDDSTRGGEYLWRSGGACTSAFTVRSYSGVEGVLTAAHCGNMTHNYDYYSGVWHRMYRQGSHNGLWGDMAWFATSGDELPEFWASSTSRRRPTGSTSGSIGQQVCFYGRFSNWRSCGHRITHINVTSSLGTGGLTRVSNPISRPGDSGGGYSWGTTVFGIHRGSSSTSMLYTPVNSALAYFGLRLQT